MKRAPSKNARRFYECRDRLATINSDVGNLLLGRYVFRELQALISDNPDLEGLFVKWLRINYVNTAVLGIRRAVDTDSRATSTANFLRHLIANPTVITRSVVIRELVYRRPRTYKRRYEPSGSRHFEAEGLSQYFDNLAGAGSEQLDVRLIGQDLSLLQRKARNVERFATKRLAHYDERPPLPATYREIDEVLDVLDSIIDKYSPVLELIWKTSERSEQFAPGMTFNLLFPEWKRIFERPWKRVITKSEG